MPKSIVRLFLPVLCLLSLLCVGISPAQAPPAVDELASLRAEIRLLRAQVRQQLDEIARLKIQLVQPASQPVANAAKQPAGPRPWVIPASVPASAVAACMEELRWPLRLGDSGPIGSTRAKQPARGTVISIDGDTAMLVSVWLYDREPSDLRPRAVERTNRPVEGAGLRYAGNYGGPFLNGAKRDLFIRGLPTRGLVDGQQIDLPQIFRIDSTTRIDGHTVFVLQPQTAATQPALSAGRQGRQAPEVAP